MTTWATCESCEGKTEVACLACHGEGTWEELECEFCLGEGTFECGHCNGTGFEPLVTSVL